MEVEVDEPRLYGQKKHVILMNPSAQEVESFLYHVVETRYNPQGILKGVECPMGDRYFWDGGLPYTHDSLGSLIARTMGFDRFERIEGYMDRRHFVVEYPYKFGG